MKSESAAAFFALGHVFLAAETSMLPHLYAHFVFHGMYRLGLKQLQYAVLVYTPLQLESLKGSFT
jgi:hypothetical protein